MRNILQIFICYWAIILIVSFGDFYFGGKLNFFNFIYFAVFTVSLSKFLFWNFSETDEVIEIYQFKLTLNSEWEKLEISNDLSEERKESLIKFYKDLCTDFKVCHQLIFK